MSRNLAADQSLASALRIRYTNDVPTIIDAQ